MGGHDVVRRMDRQDGTKTDELLCAGASGHKRFR